MVNPVVIVVIIVIVILLLLWILSASRAPTAKPTAVNYIANLVPQPSAVPNSSSGQAKATLSSDQKTFRYDVVVRNLTGSPINGIFTSGTNGRPLKTITFNPDTSSNGTTVWRSRGVWSLVDPNEPLTNGVVMDILNGNLYLTVNTPINPSGEIRGEFLPLLL